MKRMDGWPTHFGIAKSLCLCLLVLLLALVGPIGALGQTTVASADPDVSDTAKSETPKADPASTPPSTPPAPGAIALTAFPATEVNKVFPNWLHFSGEYRMRVEEHTAYSFTAGNNDGFALSRLKLNIEITPTSWVSAFVQAQDSSPIGINPIYITPSIKDIFDLHQAYIQLQNGENSWIRFRVGRQEMRYGQERLIGVSDWVNAPRVFDGFRLVVGTASDHVDIFSTSVVVNNPVAFDRHAGGMDFHGIYGSLATLVPKASVEPFIFWKALPLVKSEEGTSGNENLWTYGFRFTGKLPLNFDYTVETAKQSGNYSNDTIQAWAGYTNVGYSVPKLPLKPRFLVQYDYASGDNKLKDGIMGRFDQLYPSNHDVFGLVDLLGWENIVQMRAGVGVQPINHLAVNFDYREIYLADGHDSLYSSTGAVLVKSPTTGALSRDVGQEPDLFIKYDVRPNITLGAGYGYLFAGPFLMENSKGDRASIVYTYATYKF
jgi:hypothetical protein